MTRDRITISVQIIELRTWLVPGGCGGSTVWEDTFVRDQDAYAEFPRTLEIEGIHSFAERPSGPNELEAISKLFLGVDQL